MELQDHECCVSWTITCHITKSTATWTRGRRTRYVKFVFCHLKVRFLDLDGMGQGDFLKTSRFLEWKSVVKDFFSYCFFYNLGDDFLKLHFTCLYVCMSVHVCVCVIWVFYVQIPGSRNREPGLGFTPSSILPLTKPCLLILSKVPLPGGQPFTSVWLWGPFLFVPPHHDWLF